MYYKDMEEINFKEKLAQIINNSNLENKQKFFGKYSLKKQAKTRMKRFLKPYQVMRKILNF